MKREADEVIVSTIKVKNDAGGMLVVTEFGFAKRKVAEDFRKTKRTASVVRPFPDDENIGKLVKAIEIQETDDVIAVTKNGILLRANVSQVRELSRTAKGSRLLRLDEKDRVRDVIAVPLTELDIQENDVTLMEDVDIDTKEQNQGEMNG